MRCHQKLAFSGKQEMWMVEFPSLMWQELFISSGATVCLTVPLLYHIPVELLGQLLPMNSFLCASAFGLPRSSLHRRILLVQVSQ